MSRISSSYSEVGKWGERTIAQKLIFLDELYGVSLDELVGRIPADQYAKVKQYIKKFAAKDIPMDEEDDISAIVVRYLLFVERMGLTTEQKLAVLEEIFLCDAEGSNKGTFSQSVFRFDCQEVVILC